MTKPNDSKPASDRLDLNKTREQLRQLDTIVKRILSAPGAEATTIESPPPPPPSDEVASAQPEPRTDDESQPDHVREQPFTTELHGGDQVMATRVGVEVPGEECFLPTDEPIANQEPIGFLQVGELHSGPSVRRDAAVSRSWLPTLAWWLLLMVTGALALAAGAWLGWTR